MNHRAQHTPLQALSHRSFFPSAALALMLPLCASAAGPDTLPTITGGKPNVDLRLRYESIGTNPAYGVGVTDNFADALTARLRLGYTTARWQGFDAQVEGSATLFLNDDPYQTTDNYKADKPIIPDPDGASLNQAWLRYSGLPKTAIKLGRQRLAYDNQRFIGNVAWRQREQTYDALSLSGNWLPKATFNFAYLAQVNSFRAFRMDPANAGVSCSPAFPCEDQLDLKGEVANLAWAPKPWAAFVLYDYRLDFDFDSAARRDTDTLGLRLTGAQPAGAFKLSYTAEYARQKGIADSPDGLKAHYLLLEAGANWQRYGLKLGHEVLSGNGSYGFQTPLATLHIFQGWADLLVTTPATGVVDDYASLSATVNKASLGAVYHYFGSESGNQQFGYEWDLIASGAMSTRVNIGFKFANYRGNRNAPDVPRRSDTQKAWAWVEYKF